MSDADDRKAWIQRLKAAHNRSSAAQGALEAHAARAMNMAQTGQDTDDAYWQIYGERLEAAGTRQKELEAIYRERLSLPLGA